MADRLQMVLATRNPGKVAELQALLEGLKIEFVPASQFPGAPEVEESADTLEGNARLKAEALHNHTGWPALADDTGLEVTALGGRPGVYSARYAGPEADERKNRALLLKEMEGMENRQARFRTVIALANGEGARYFEGVCEGHLTPEERGVAGFGYDPIFMPDGHTRTFAEMSVAEKNAISHRGQALQKLIAYLRQYVSNETADR
jgi:XTP/dITP diphosphohydrolase